MIFTYFLKEPLEGEVTLTLTDDEGRLIKDFSNSQPQDQSANGEVEPRLLGELGMNRFV